MKLYKVLIDSNAPPMALPSALRRAGVSELASSLLGTLRMFLEASSQAVARSMFKRTMSAHRLARVSVMHGLKLRVDLVAALEPGMKRLRKWLSEPPDNWPFPASRGGPGPPKFGCTLCKL